MIKNTIAEDLDDCQSGFLSPDTECLIKYKGWTTYDKIEIGDLVCSMNPDDRSSAWQRVSDIRLETGKHKMLSYDSCRFSFSVTETQNLFGWYASSSKFVTGNPNLTTAKNMPCIWSFPINTTTGCGIKIAGGLPALAGLILTDGTFYVNKKNNPTKRRDTTIYQSKDPEPIRKVLDDAGMIWKEYVRIRNTKQVCGKKLVKDPLPERSFCISWKCRSIIDDLIQTRDRLPRWVWDCDTATFNELLDGLLLGDGSIYSFPRKITTRILYGKKAILDDVQAVAICHGWTANIAKDNRGAYRLNLCLVPIRSIFRRNIVNEDVTDTVWNIKIPLYQNFLVRRNGKSHFTGSF